MPTMQIMRNFGYVQSIGDDDDDGTTQFFRVNITADSWMNNPFHPNQESWQIHIDALRWNIHLVLSEW